MQQREISKIKLNDERERERELGTDWPMTFSLSDSLCAPGEEEDDDEEEEGCGGGKQEGEGGAQSSRIPPSIACSGPRTADGVLVGPGSISTRALV